MMTRSIDCSLCRLETITKEYYRNEDFVIIDCMSCDVPMAVAIEHIDPMDLSCIDLRVEMYKKLLEVGAEFYKEKNGFFVDMRERNILDHLHWHVRPRRK